MGDSTIEELNEKVCRITEEKKRMKSEIDKSIEDLELSKKAAEAEFLLQQEEAKETIRNLEEAMSLQQQEHSSSAEISEELLNSTEVKLNAGKKELDDIQSKCVESVENLAESEKEIARLRKERIMNCKWK